MHHAHHTLTAAQRHDAESFGREVAAAHPLHAKATDVGAAAFEHAVFADMGRLYAAAARKAAEVAQARRQGRKAVA